MNRPTLPEDRVLLNTMLTASEHQHELWQPSSYWRTYCNRILRALDRDGLTNVRANQDVLKGFAGGGVLRPTRPGSAWKRAIWQGIESMPGVTLVIREYQRLLHAQRKHHVEDQCRLGRLVLDRIADEADHFVPPSGLANGGADDAFEWNGHTISAAWVPHVVRAHAFYRAVGNRKIGSIAEIGPGLGLSTLAHVALNPSLTTVVNVDIPPVLYVATQFLRSIPLLTVKDFREVATDSFSPSAASSVAGPTVYMLAPWQLSEFDFTADAAMNFYSFQEMERDVCAAYAEALKRRVRTYVFLMSMHKGHRPGAGGQIEPIPLSFLIGVFSEAFEPRAFDDPLLALYHPPEEVVLLQRKN